MTHYSHMLAVLRQHRGLLSTRVSRAVVSIRGVITSCIPERGKKEVGERLGARQVSLIGSDVFKTQREMRNKLAGEKKPNKQKTCLRYRVKRRCLAAPAKNESSSKIRLLAARAV